MLKANTASKERPAPRDGAPDEEEEAPEGENVAPAPRDGAPEGENVAPATREGTPEGEEGPQERGAGPNSSRMRS